MSANCPVAYDHTDELDECAVCGWGAAVEAATASGPKDMSRLTGPERIREAIDRLSGRVRTDHAHTHLRREGGRRVSASMAEVLAEHRFLYGQRYGVERVEHCSCGWQTNSGTRAWEALAAHQAEQLAANGYGKLEDAWEAGRRAGYDAGSRWARTGEDKDTPNPYRRPE